MLKNLNPKTKKLLQDKWDGLSLVAKELIATTLKEGKETMQEFSLKEKITKRNKNERRT